MMLATTREGPEPAAVQTELKTALDAALTEVRAQSEPGQLDVRTGNFSLYPKQSKDGRISTWQGRAELVLEGRDFARISAAAGRIRTLTVSQSSFGLSREQRGPGGARCPTAGDQKLSRKEQRSSEELRHERSDDSGSQHFGE